MLHAELMKFVYEVFGTDECLVLKEIIDGWQNLSYRVAIRLYNFLAWTRLGTDKLYPVI